MNQRRGFIKKIGLGVLSTTILSDLSAFKSDDVIKFDGLNIPNFPNNNDDEFWSWVRMEFNPSPSHIYLNNAGLSPAPKMVRDAIYRMMEFANEAPTYTLWRVLEAGRANIKNKIAQNFNCSEDEVSIVRNATEALNTIIMKIPLNKGDEVINANLDYPRMTKAWKFREKSCGIILKTVKLDIPENDENAIVEKYVSLMTSKTKIIYLTMLINWTGQLIPVAKIASEAKKRGILVIIDPTQAVGQMKVDLKELGADYAGFSGHKWLNGPLGTGVIFIKKEYISKIDSFFSPSDSDNMLKFDDQGTRNSTLELALAHTFDFNEYIGLERKQNRLIELKEYWINAIKDHPNVIIHSPISKNLSGAIGVFSLKNMASSIIINELSINNIVATRCTHETLDGIRVSASIYNNKYELDRFINIILHLAKQ